MLEDEVCLDTLVLLWRGWFNAEGHARYVFTNKRFYMSEEYHWTCPFCDRDTTITQERQTLSHVDLLIPNAEGPRRLNIVFIVCPNPKCRRFTLSADLRLWQMGASGPIIGKRLQSWKLIPASRAVAFPDYVPRPVVADYNEACLIMDASPKASATLSRRCLQGVLRDFWAVKPGRLVDEIEQVKDKVDPLTWEAIDSVRRVGNIGAHMEKDIDVIVDVEPQEAELLVGLIETLIRDWYVGREEKRVRLLKIKGIAEKKDELKKGAAGA